MDQITIKQVPIEEAVKLNAEIEEFDPKYSKQYYEDRYQEKQKLIIIAYLNDQPAGYIVAYDKFGDGSLYCWMAGVKSDFRQKGILKAMMDYQDGWAKSKSYNKIKIKTRNNRREMLSYLIKYGFNLIELIPFPKTEDHRILFEKKL